MKIKIEAYWLFMLICSCTLSSNCQLLKANVCDSQLLSKEEYVLCVQDSAWTEDIPIKINFIATFQTQLLPKYWLERQKIKLPKELSNLLPKFRNLYDSILNNKIQFFSKVVDRNRMYVQPKSYLSTMLSLELFRLYPDVYAILLNDIHLQVRPKTSPKDFLRYHQYFDSIIAIIPENLYAQLAITVSSFHKEKIKFVNKQNIFPFQGTLEKSLREKYDIVSFLLWDR